MDTSLLREFRLDWQLSGKAPRTACDYIAAVEKLLEQHPDPTLADVKQWIASTSSVTTRRKRGQAVRAIGKWANTNEYEIFLWWRNVPLAKEIVLPQETATESDYRRARKSAISLRDKALIEVLWSSGLRRSEITRLTIADTNLAEGFLIVRTAKSGIPRVAPLSPAARHSLRRFMGSQSEVSLFGMTSNAIRLCLERMGAPSAHAWRRGWAVQSLRLGISEASVKSAAGWSSGAMVSRYTRTLSGELAIDEFTRMWNLR
jgi:integrase/recombinase XerD